MIILASGSPRRRELLKLITDEFKVVVSDADESLKSITTPKETVEILSQRKAESVLKLVDLQNDIIIAADTVVAINNEILGKPENRDNAFEMLKKLSGKVHSVYTGVTVIKNEINKVFSVKSEVEFFELSDSEIECYLDTGEYADKAGSYGIQGYGALFVKSINGDYNNIVGLPVSTLSRVLKKM